MPLALVATPSKTHAEIVPYGLERGVDVFCEKPFVLDPRDGEPLVELARQGARVTQVGYHYRFVGAFREAKRLLAASALGRIHHVRAEAYGPVVLRSKGSTWRGARAEGGGCLYDYASHAIDLVNFLVGAPAAVSGTSLAKVFSRDGQTMAYVWPMQPWETALELDVPTGKSVQYYAASKGERVDLKPGKNRLVIAQERWSRIVGLSYEELVKGLRSLEDAEKQDQPPPSDRSRKRCD